MKRLISLSKLLVFLALFVSLHGCGIVRKKTKTITETIIKIDTILIYKHDTIPIIKKAYLHDTIKIENSSSKVIVYVDTTLHMIVAKLEGKPLSIPIIINSHIRTTTVEKSVKRKTNWFFYFILGAGSLAAIYVIIKEKWIK